MLFIDIHSHSTALNNPSEIRIQSIIMPNLHPTTNFYTTGWHPWFIEKHTTIEIKNELQKIQHTPNLLAIGECGLDRAINTPIDIQKKVFKMHLEKAISLQLPVLIHCVKAYSDILDILKKTKFTLPVIFHDYRGNKQQSDELLKFNSFFSFGKSLINPTKKLETTFKYLPLNKIFFETDESDFSIQNIYIRAAELRNILVEDLMRQIEDNFKNIFGDELAR